MKIKTIKILPIGLASWALLSLSGCSSSSTEVVAGERTRSAMHEDSIVQFYERWFDALENGDTEASLRLLDEDFALKPPLGPPVTDANQLRTRLTALSLEVQQEIDWRIEDYGIHGGWAWARVAERAKHTPKAGGEAKVFNGSHLSILRRSDGTWRLHRDHASLNEVPEAD